MTKTLEAAIERLRELPADEQDSLAQILLDEMDADKKWAATTAKYPDAVAKLTKEVQDAYQRGECDPLDPETL